MYTRKSEQYLKLQLNTIPYCERNLIDRKRKNSNGGVGKKCIQIDRLRSDIRRARSLRWLVMFNCIYLEDYNNSNMHWRETNNSTKEDSALYR